VRSENISIVSEVSYPLKRDTLGRDVRLAMRKISSLEKSVPPYGAAKCLY